LTGDGLDDENGLRVVGDGDDRFCGDIFEFFKDFLQAVLDLSILME
jgi:hypothetical protein